MNVVLGLLYIHEEGVGNAKERGEGGGNRNKGSVTESRRGS